MISIPRIHLLIILGYDAFICHASEDKAAVVKPLAELLTKMGFYIWYDEFELEIGDSLRQSVDRGLLNSNYGIVILSKAFFVKNWPQYELNGLAARELDGKKLYFLFGMRLPKKRYSDIALRLLIK
jgi:uncharacterized protein YxjI